MARKIKPPKDETAEGRIFERPDGFYWEASGGAQPPTMRGPFASRAEAEADRLAGGAAGGDFGVGETLEEAESEIGVSEWIDPDTGGPAEDGVPRIEDH